MNLEGNKFVRLEDWKSEKYFNSRMDHYGEDGFYAGRLRPMVTGAFRRGFDTITRLILKLPIANMVPSWKNPWISSKEERILDPLHKWNKIYMFVCVLAVAIDPLFLYVPWVRGKDQCLDLDHSMKLVVCALRTLIDAFYIFPLIYQFRSCSSRVLGRGKKTVEDPALISQRHLSSYFFIDVLAVLPLPQAVLLIIAPSVKGPISFAAMNWLGIVIFLQYVPRFARILPFASSSRFLTATAHAGAVFILFLYMLASHMIGAFWYLLSIQREVTCWLQACSNTGETCFSNDFYCGYVNRIDLKGSCSFIQPDPIRNSSVFNFGIFTDALDSGVVESKNFQQKLFYCFWWGLRNLRSVCLSLGQNLKTSTYVGEIFFAVFIAVFGLVLLSLLIGHMQKFLLSVDSQLQKKLPIRYHVAELKILAACYIQEAWRRRDSSSIERYRKREWEELERMFPSPFSKGDGYNDLLNFRNET